MHTRLRFLRILLVILAVSLPFLGGCSDSAYERSDKPDGDWSRGLLLGESNIKQPAAFAVDTGRHVHMAWTERLSEQQEGVHYAQLSPQGQVSVDRTLPIDLPAPRRPQLLVDRNNRLHLVLLSRTDDTQRLYHVLLDANGQTGDPTLLSEEEEEVNSFHTFLSATGEMAFLWESQPEAGQPGIYHAVLQNNAIVSRSLLVPGGIDPAILVDRDGTTHLTWLFPTGFTARGVYYATLEGTQLHPPEGQQLTSFEYAESATYHGPVMGADTERLYVMWSVENLGGGLTPTASFGYYVSFPPGEPQLSRARTLRLPPDVRPDYVAHASPYGYDELAPLSPGVYSTDFVNVPDTVQRQETELPVTLSLKIESASKAFIQLAMVVFSGGEPVGYQLINNTPNASVLSSITADADADLHLTWLDVGGFGRYKVYYATTAPQAREWLDRTTPGDVARGGAGLTFGILSGLGLAFLGLTWNVLPLLSIILFYIIGREEHLDLLTPKIGLGVAIFLYIASKAYFIPGLLTAGTPFLYAVPPDMRMVLMYAVPVLILLLALASIYVYTRRAEEPTMFKAYLFFALTELLLTAVLYGPRFFSTR
jgi:hypothetical protein